MSEVTMMEELQGIANCCECEATEKRLNGWIKKASAAPEQQAVEPVEPVVIEVQNGCVYLISKPLEPGRHKLYTHADPSEVERLRAELQDAIAGAKEAMRQKDELRDQLGATTQRTDAADQKLANAQALLREVAHAYRTTTCSVYKILPRVDAFLSATAQHAEVKS